MVRMYSFRKVGFIQDAGEVMKVRALRQAMPRRSAGRIASERSLLLLNINFNETAVNLFIAAVLDAILDEIKQHWEPLTAIGD